MILKFHRAISFLRLQRKFFYPALYVLLPLENSVGLHEHPLELREKFQKQAYFMIFHHP